MQAKVSPAANAASEQEAEVLRLKEEIRCMAEREERYLCAIVVCKEEVRELRAKLEQMEGLLFPITVAQHRQAAGRSIHKHRTRTILF
jgi:hypothetical protein